jgi:integrase/recombinase XerD
MKKRAALHTLRPGIATHLPEIETGTRYKRELPEVHSSEMTLIFTFVSIKKMSEIKSPFDDLEP